MTDLIESRIKAIKEGKLPEGYKRTKAGIMPVDWDGTIQAKKLFKKHTDKKHDGDLEILAATQERGIVPRSQIGIDIQCSDEGVNGYKKVSKGDFVISLRSFQGGIEYSEYTGIISPVYTVLKPIKDISTGFYRNYFKTDTFIKRLNGAVYGIRDGKQIGYEDFGDMYVHCPPLAEQECIAEILIQCDRVIELKEKKLDELKQLKKEFLRKMFPAKGCDTPEIRFPGFTGAWEQRKLGEIYGLIGNAFVGTATPYYVEQGHFYLESNNVKDGQINHNSEIFINDEFYEKQKDKWLHTGDMVMVQSGHVGHAAVIPEVLDNTAAHALIMFRNPKEKIEPYFLNFEYQTNKSKKKIENITTGNTIKHILASDMQEFEVDVPKYEEQKAIAEYFANLDNLITLHQRELEETKTYKKTLAKLLLTGIVRVQG